MHAWQGESKLEKKCLISIMLGVFYLCSKLASRHPCFLHRKAVFLEGALEAGIRTGRILQSDSVIAQVGLCVRR